MALVTYLDMAPDVLANATNCPDFLAERELRRTAIDFFSRTQAYRITATASFDGSLSVDISGLLPQETRMEEVVYVQYSGASRDIELRPTSERGILRIDQNWRNITGEPRYFLHADPHILSFYPHPPAAEANVLTLRIAVIPTRLSSGVEEDYVDRYYEALIDGATARVLSMSQEAWGNPVLAGPFQQRYMDEVHGVTDLIQRSGTRVVREVQYGGL